MAADMFQKYGAVAVATASATLIPDMVGRRTLFIQNLGPNEIYVGFDSSVTSSTGIKVAANGGALSLDVNDNVHVYARAATALQSSPADTRYLAVSNAGSGR